MPPEPSADALSSQYDLEVRRLDELSRDADSLDAQLGEGPRPAESVPDADYHTLMTLISEQEGVVATAYERRVSAKRTDCVES